MADQPALASWRWSYFLALLWRGMMVFLKRFPTHRFELLTAIFLVTSSFSLVWLAQRKHAPELSAWLAVFILELLLPLLTGLMTAGLLAGDNALDLLFSVVRPAWQILGERLLFVGGTGILFGSLALLLFPHWGVSLPREGSDRIFIWLAPMIFSMGLSSAGALLRGRLQDGMLLTVIGMGGSLLVLSQLRQLCARVETGEACTWWLASPVLTIGDASAVYWPLNRLLWLGIGAALLILSFRLTRREEEILSGKRETGE